MTKEVLITISGVQKGSKDEPVVITASGTYHFANERHYVQYEEKVEDADLILKNIIKISPEKIILMKKGAQSSQMIFDLHQEDQAVYQTPYGSFSFTTDTKSIVLRETADRIEVRMEYSLSSDSSKVSDNEILIIIENNNQRGK